MHDSVYYQKRGEFKTFLQTIADKSLTVRDVIGDWREFGNLAKEFKDLTIQQIIDGPKQIEKLYNELRNGTPAQSKFELQWDREIRCKELIVNIAANYPIHVGKAAAKIVTGKGVSSERKFPYCLEVVMAPRSDLGPSNAGEIEIIGNVNGSPSIDGGESYFQYTYTWMKKRKIVISYNLRGILSECGFTSTWNTRTSKKRVPCVMYINLITPCPDWIGGAGKTTIDMRPYADRVAKVVSSLAIKMPSYHGERSTRPVYAPIREKTAKDYFQDFLIQRYRDIQADPSILKTDRLTHPGVWYRVRPQMLDNGFEPRDSWGKTRVGQTGSIAHYCKELSEAGAFGGRTITREDLGIVASARAMMFYDGYTYPIDIDSFKELGSKGVFILLIEKEGIAKVFKDVAKGSGVALVYTRGRFTEQVKDLIDAAVVPLGILTDYDAYGDEIAKSPRTKTPRIGINEDIIQWLNNNGRPDVTRESVEEEYTPSIHTDNEYLKHHRIELDSIQQKVQAELFWKYIKEKIEELQREEGFDYNNIIRKPEVKELYPEPIKQFLQKLEAHYEKMVKHEWDKIAEEQESIKELISISDRKAKNESRLDEVVTNDEDTWNEIIPKIEELDKNLDDFLEE